MTQAERDELIQLGVEPGSTLWAEFERGVRRLDDGWLVPTNAEGSD